MHLGGETMELYYNLIAVYSDSDKQIQETEEKLEALIDEGYVEEKEVVEIATKNNAVIMIEVEQDDGLSETILVNNKGTLKERAIFSLERVEEVRAKIKEVTCEKYFTKTAKKVVLEHSEAHGISYQEFIEEYLDEYLLDEYEKSKVKWAQKIEKYFLK